MILADNTVLTNFALIERLDLLDLRLITSASEPHLKFVKSSREVCEKACFKKQI